MIYIFFGFILLAFLGLAFLALTILLYGARAAWKISDSKRIRELKETALAAKIEVDILRAERLRRDLGVVSNRAILVGNQAVIADLRIEEKRRELGLDATEFVPNP